MMKQTQNEGVIWLELLQLKSLPGRQKTFYRWSAGLVFGLIGSLLGCLICGAIGSLSGGLISGTIDALFGGLVFGLPGVLIGKIEPVEAFIWSWKRTKSVLLFWPLIGLLIGLFGALVYALVSSLFISQTLGSFFGLLYLVYVGLPDGLHLGLASGLLGGLFASVIYGFTTEQLAERFTFFQYEGIHRSMKNGLVGASLGVLAGVPFSVLSGSLIFMLVGLIVGGLVYGLRAVIQYLILRFWLWRSLRLAQHT